MMNEVYKMHAYHNDVEFHATAHLIGPFLRWSWGVLDQPRISKEDLINGLMKVMPDIHGWEALAQHIVQ